MVEEDIFTVFGILVSIVCALSPFAIALGGAIAFFTTCSYVELALYYKDKETTYNFKRTYPKSSFTALFVGWYNISTLTLYAYTFASYGMSGL